MYNYNYNYNYTIHLKKCSLNISFCLITNMYFYIHAQTIKDNNNTNFQKTPDNFNFELNEIQTVKPILKIYILLYIIYI